MADELAGAGKDRFTSLDTIAATRELRAIGRAFVDKVFDLPAGGLAIALRSPTVGRRELRIVPGRYVAILPQRSEHPEEPGPFARELRRLLTGSVLTDVPDPGGERYLEIQFRRADVPDPLTLAVELFGTGNVLVARGERLVAVAHPKTWAHRSVRIGADYHRPPSRGDPWRRSAAELEAVLAQSRTDRASTLAARMALGGPIAEELLARTGLLGSVPAPTDAATSAARLHGALAELLGELGDAPKGYLYRKGETWMDVEPFRSARWVEAGEVVAEERPTFSEAVETYFSAQRPLAETATPDPAVAELEELRRLQERQQAAVAELANEADRLRSLADAIYARYAEAEALREAAVREGREGVVEIALGDLRIPIRPSESLDRSARALYEGSKVLQRKVEGAREALGETERRIAAPRTPAAPRVSAAAVAASRPLWFERYRWFLSTEGLLVVGGRDAASNDLLVRRYLRPKDRYVHADVHGAPSVVVKHAESGGSAPDPTTMREAGQLSVAFSKAWRAGLASGSAFWVEPEQVSKAGASGEFVARGAWVIHGTKNALNDLPTELAIGTVEVQGRTLWCVGPPSAMRARGAVRFRLVPGEERERAAREVELAGALGISRSRLQALLPAGGFTILPA